jgi:hypothetical protein
MFVTPSPKTRAVQLKRYRRFYLVSRWEEEKRCNVFVPSSEVRSTEESWRLYINLYLQFFIDSKGIEAEISSVKEIFSTSYEFWVLVTRTLERLDGYSEKVQAPHFSSCGFLISAVARPVSLVIWLTLEVLRRVISGVQRLISRTAAGEAVHRPCVRVWAGDRTEQAVSLAWGCMVTRYSSLASSPFFIFILKSSSLENLSPWRRARYDGGWRALLNPFLAWLICTRGLRDSFILQVTYIKYELSTSWKVLHNHERF